VYELSQHLFFECSFFVKVWSNVLIWLDVSYASPNDSILVCHGKAIMKSFTLYGWDAFGRFGSTIII